MAYEAVRAFARGLMDALMKADEAPKQPRVNVVKPEDVEAACARYIDKLLAGTPPQEPPPDAHDVRGQMDLPLDVVPPEMRDLVRDVAGDLGTIPDEHTHYDAGPAAPGVTRASERESMTYDPNMPGEGAAWQTPRS